MPFYMVTLLEDLKRDLVLKQGESGVSAAKGSYRDHETIPSL